MKIIFTFQRTLDWFFQKYEKDDNVLMFIIISSVNMIKWLIKHVVLIKSYGNGGVNESKDFLVPI